MQQISFAWTPRARARKVLLLSFVITACVWTWFTWPLPAHFSKGIPFTATETTTQRVVTMIPGDPLQLLYHFWLAGDMMRGETPLFHNLYEFNTGNDQARKKVGPYYFPFSFLYWVGESLGGRAFGWNSTGFLTLWMTYGLLFLLARRYTPSDGVAFVAALPGITLPLQWISLLGGSPFGFAVMWCPALLWGLDLAVRNQRVAGGALAGLAVLFASWTDSHIFFFCLLAAPLGAALAFLQRESPRLRGRGIRELAVSLLPVAFLGGAALLINRLCLSKSAAALMAAGGRQPEEALVYSPAWRGFIQHVLDSTSVQAYIGWPILLCVAAAIVMTLFSRPMRSRLFSRPDRTVTLTVFLLLVALGGIVLLALGPRGPADGLAFRVVRKLIPPYTMIRQPAKIFCFVPSILAILAALAWTRLGALMPRRLMAVLLPLWTVVLLADYRYPIRTAVCLLDNHQAAYAAVEKDAAARHVKPHLLVLPLWPGNSHWTSPYLYHASLYRLRLLNGYQPFVNQDYMTNVFQRLSSVNKGCFDESHFTWLDGAGVNYLILHENAFPEKISPFPVGDTLRRLLENPRLHWLAQADGVWAFRIDPPGTSPAPPRPAPSLPVLFPARSWEVEQLSTNLQGVVEDHGASGGRAVHLTPDSGRHDTMGVSAARDERLQWLIRVRGTGTLIFGTAENGTNRAARSLPVQVADWQWLAVPVEQQGPYASLAASLAVDSGFVDVDLVIFAGDPGQPLVAGGSIALPAASFFHAGYSDPETMRVVLRPVRDAADVVFYGWRYPLEPGRYRVDLAFDSAAPPGTLLGTLVCQDWMGRTDLAPVKAGEPATGLMVRTDNLPVRIGFRFAGRAKVELSELKLSRLE
ncbi:MAG: hypothetical protein WCS01_06100 [bacterium]